MAVPEPSWRVKTRPCPFYQQGRCLFSESCNFLHTVSAHVNTDAKATNEATGPRTPHNPPRVVIDSPHSGYSSPRSPRTTQLLLALGDVVADPAEDNEDNETAVGPSTIPNTEQNTWSESLPTLVNELGFGSFSQPDEDSTEHPFVSYEADDVDSDANWTAISDYEDDTISQPVQEFLAQSIDNHVDNVGTSAPAEPAEQPAAVDWTTSPDHDVVQFSYRNSIASTSGLLSPIELSTLNFGPFRQSSRDSGSFDSGYAETWKAPIPLLASPPRSPSVSSTFDLLSSPFGVHSARISSPRLGVFMPRSPASPARTISPYVVEDVEPVDLGVDSPGNRQDETTYLTPPDSPSESASMEKVDNSDLVDSRQDSVDASEDDQFDSYGHTSIWEPEGAETAVFMGDVDEGAVQQEVNEAIIYSSKTPTHFLSSTLDFQTEEAVGHSSTANDDGPSLLNIENTDGNDDEGDDDDDASKPVGSPSTSMDDDNTAYLAYLRSPMAVESTENDTLDSLYNSYSVVSFDRSSVPHPTINTNLSPRQPDLSAVSNISTPSSSLRERVFTPPPATRKRSGTITADSPNSLSSPITSPLSMGCSSPFSDRPFIMQNTRSESPYGQDVELSRKIPFGFRSSFALGRASKSTLMTSRNGRRSIPSSPLQTHPEIPGSEPDDPSPNPPPSSSRSLPKGLKPLRLSTILDAKYTSRPKNHSRMSSSSVKNVNNSRLSGNFNRTSISSASVSSIKSLSDNHLLSSTRSSPSPSHISNSLLSSEHSEHSSASEFPNGLAHLNDPPQSAPVSSWRKSVNYSRPSSRLSEPCYPREEEDDSDDYDTGRFSRDPYDETIRRSLPPPPHTAPNSRTSVLQQPMHTIETPKPTLMFAIASDDVEQVRQVLANGDAGPNECVGPQSALEFTLTNDKLSNKLEIVKALLAYGADPTVAKSIEIPPSKTPPSHQDGEDTQEQPRTLMEEMDPATRYYLERADSLHTRRMSVLIHRSFFRPLTRVRYDLIGQDRALEQLFRVLSMHSRELAVSPMVVMLCGPSGHGKSLLARKFGSLLEVPTHTVNMTTLRSTHDLWESHSMSPYETPTTCTLAEFLMNNEGKRCVVVLDEIEKTEDPKTLYSLLMPWELGRCAFEAGKRHVDVKNVIWLGTSNIGHDLVFQHRDTRKNAEELMSREEYVELMALLRPKVSERLGTSILSRITTVLPFVPFTPEEKRAICSETLYSLGGELARTLLPEEVQKMIDTALASYCADEGARSLHRAISNQLVDII